MVEMLNLLWAKCPHSVSSGSLWEPLSICFFLYWQSLIFFSLCLRVTWSRRAYHKSSTCWRWLNTLDGPLAQQHEEKVSHTDPLLKLRAGVDWKEKLRGLSTQHNRSDISIHPILWCDPHPRCPWAWSGRRRWPGRSGKLTKVDWMNALK